MKETLLAVADRFQNRNHLKAHTKNPLHMMGMHGDDETLGSTQPLLHEALRPLSPVKLSPPRREGEIVSSTESRLPLKYMMSEDPGLTHHQWRVAGGDGDGPDVISITVEGLAEVPNVGSSKIVDEVLFDMIQRPLSPPPCDRSYPDEAGSGEIFASVSTVRLHDSREMGTLWS